MSTMNFPKRNVMSFRVYREKHGATNLIENPKKPGSFFMASSDGSVCAIGENALAYAKDQNNSVDQVLDTLQFHEFSPDGGDTWIPCLTKPSEANVVRSF